MTNGSIGCTRGDWKRGVRAKAVSSLRFATAVQDASRGVTREEEAMLAGVPRCCGSQTRAPFAPGAFAVAAVILQSWRRDSILRVMLLFKRGLWRSFRA